MAKNDDSSRPEAGFDSNFDSRLLGAGEGSSSKSKAGALNEAKHQSENNEEGTQSEPTTLREAVIAEKRKQQQAEQEKSSGLKKMATAPMRQGTSKLLQAAWMNSPWIWPILWINIHAFLSLVIGKEVFCRLGDEWLDGKIGGASSAKEAALGEAGSKMTDKISGCANLGESMLLAILDLILLVIIIAILALISGLIKILDDLASFNFLSTVSWVVDLAKAIISS
jgi:hypothetical protein